MNNIKSYLPPIIWMIVIFCASSLPGPAFPRQPFPGFDKLVHIGIYAILSILWYRSLRGVPAQRLLIVVLIGIFYGISDEIHQIFVPLREFDIQDILADAVGSVVGVLLYMGILKWR